MQLLPSTYYSKISSKILMGVFSQWRLFTKSEILLEECIKKNPYYPFHLLGSNDSSAGSDVASTHAPPVYVYACRLKRFYAALLVFVASFLFIIIWPAAGGEAEYLGFGFSALVLSGYVALEYYSVRRVVLDPESFHYSVYKGSKLIASEHCHNIYIRLLSKSSGSHIAFYLVLDGVGLEEPIHLTKGTINKKKLRHLAHTLTNNLNLNYFDVHDISKHQPQFRRSPLAHYL